jgi:hypothetical protein
LPQEQHCYKMYWKMKLHKLKKFKGYYIYLISEYFYSISVPCSKTFHDAFLQKDITHFCYTRAGYLQSTSPKTSQFYRLHITVFKLWSQDWNYLSSYLTW